MANISTTNELLTQVDTDNQNSAIISPDNGMPITRPAVVRHYGSLKNQKVALDLPWIQVTPDAPYFITESGENWTPIGQNDAITWPDFANAYRRKDMQQVEGHMAWLAGHGVTCLRFMLEYTQTENRYLEKPVGKLAPNMVRLWDDLFALCAKYNMRVLLTPFDTFWMWIRWKHHPYNKKNGGPCSVRSKFLLCPKTREAIKQRLTFVTERWGGSGVLFAWDLWNEIHPAYANKTTDVFHEFIQDISQHLRQTEERLHGRSHLQTVSLYGPVLQDHPQVADVIFRHTDLDFASTHFYDKATIDNPKDTVGSAIVTGRLTREAISHTPPARPFFDSEHGPIHAFKDKHIIQTEAFDDEYFCHMQWAHLASGGAGGGMRWPYRHPHVLTHGMRRAQKSMAEFCQLIDWKHFLRRNINEEITLNTAAVAPFGCTDGKQAVIWLLRTDSLQRNGILDKNAQPIAVQLQLPEIMEEGAYDLIYWDTDRSQVISEDRVEFKTGEKILKISRLVTNLALALRKVEEISK